jgi:protein-L-isoaspartate O-methyltransferase
MLFITISLTAIALSLIALYTYQIFNGAPYVVTNQEDIQTMIKLADVQPNDRVVDLGAGDGEVVIAFAKAGAYVDGYEILPWLVWRSRKRIKMLNLQDKASMHWKSFWHVNLSPYDIVTVYGMPHVMPRLERKLKQELKPESRVISNYYLFPNFKPIKSLNNHIHLYTR